LQQILGYAVKQEVLIKNPAADLEVPDMGLTETARIRSRKVSATKWSMQELAKFVHAVD
jgi:hypothetical protein